MDTLNDDLCYQALKTRDARFDGRFYTAVLTTGIFCRPICPAVTPKRGNVRFYPSAETAMANGFRPCLRCRPEAAPGSPAAAGVHTTVARAVRLVDEGALDNGSVAELAERLGASPLPFAMITALGASTAFSPEPSLSELNPPIDETIWSSVGRGPLGRDSSAARMARRCSGMVPQQPPTMFTQPFSANSLIQPATSLAEASNPPMPSGMPDGPGASVVGSLALALAVVVTGSVVSMSPDPQAPTRATAMVMDSTSGSRFTGPLLMVLE